MNKNNVIDPITGKEVKTFAEALVLLAFYDNLYWNPYAGDKKDGN